MKGSGKHHGGGKKHPTYIGIFAKDSKEAQKVVRGACKDAILDVLKQFNPQSYLQEGEEIDKTPPIHEHERVPTQQELQRVEKDLSTIEAFSSPNDNYHITCLFIGHKADKLKKEQEQIYKNWNEGHKQPIQVDFILYVPNHILAAYTPQVGEVEVENKFPHMTLLLKAGTSAVESNALIESLANVHPEILEQREKKVIALELPFKSSQMMYVINRKFEMEGLCGNNFVHGRIEK